MDSIPEQGFLRLHQVLKLIPVGKSTWWAGVRSGRFPQPTKALGVRITAWSAESIRELIRQSSTTAKEPSFEAIRRYVKNKGGLK